MKRLKRLLHRKRKNSGFTLVELIISCGLLGILMLGVTAFIGPVLKSVSSNEKDVAASLLAQTMDEYINRSIRDSYYVAIFTDASRSQTGDNGSITKKDSIQAMKKFATDNSDIYEMKCMSFVWTEDPQTNEYKYMLMTETVKTTTGGLVTNSETDISKRMPQPVFEYCFYDYLFPQVEIEQLKGRGAAPDDMSSLDVSDPDSEVPVPAIKNTYTISTTQDMSAVSFIGVGYTEFGNVRADSDENKTMKFKFYPVEDMESGQEHPSTFIYYVVRKPVKFEFEATPTT